MSASPGAVAWRVEVVFGHLGSHFVLPRAVEPSDTPVLVLEQPLPSAPNNVVPAWRRVLIEEQHPLLYGDIWGGAVLIFF